MNLHTLNWRICHTQPDAHKFHNFFLGLDYKEKILVFVIIVVGRSCSYSLVESNLLFV